LQPAIEPTPHCATIALIHKEIIMKVLSSIAAFVLSLFSTSKPALKFATGERVNHIRRGTIERTDGYVIANTDSGVLVEWPRGGFSMLQNHELTVIG
jgi:hypothetical protein